MRIGLLFNRTRAYGRGFCAGVASWTEVRPGWRLEMLDGIDGIEGCDGIIAHVMDERSAERFASLGIPVVADFYREPCAGLAQALPDHEAIGALAAEFLRERGFSRFAFCGYDGILFSDARRDAFAAALAATNHSCFVYETPQAVLDGFDNNVILREELAPKAADSAPLGDWLTSLPKPCAVFCCHDLRAFQVLAAAKERGLAIPRELAVVGVDNDALICSFTTPRLSSIDNNAFGCGRAAIELLDDMLSGRAARDEIRKVPPKGVVARDSSEVFNYPSSVLNAALMFMRRNIATNLTAAEIIAHVGKSHTFVENLFRSELGTTVQNELRRLRLVEAKRLLRMTEIPLGEVARRSGFSSLRYFISAFNAAEGVSPASFRDSPPHPVTPCVT